jgi:dihydrodipicolinate synthase
MKFEGTIVAMVTPFTKNNEIDEKGIRENISYLIENGVDGILAAGSTGESATLSHDEHRKLLDILIDEVDGRVTTIAGAGSNSSKEALGLVKHAEDIGADGALVITPYYNKPQQNGLYEHYNMVTDSTNIPVIVYNEPSRTGTDIDVDTIGKVAQLDNIVAIKEGSPDLDKVSKIIKKIDEIDEKCEFAVLSGNDNITLPMIALGAKGVMSVVANLDPTRMGQLVNYALGGDFKTASKVHYELYDLMKVLFIETNPVPVKTALNMMGRPAGDVRMPLAPLNEENKVKLKEVLENIDLI